MEPSLFWAMILILLGLVLVVLEIFIPSGGILGFLAVSAVVAGVVMSFYAGGSQSGMLFLAGSIVALPVAIVLAFKYLPYTPVGRMLMLGSPKRDDVLPEKDGRDELEELIGRFGTAKTKMLPSGAITLSGRTYEAVSEGMPIEMGQPVEVVLVRNMRLVVRLADRKPPDETDLSRPIDSLGLDSFDEPLA